MKTFTYQQAIEILNINFSEYRILKVWDTIKELSILFTDRAGKKWEMFSSGDSYFQAVEDFVIYEVK